MNNTKKLRKCIIKNIKYKMKIFKKNTSNYYEINREIYNKDIYSYIIRSGYDSIYISNPYFYLLIPIRYKGEDLRILEKLNENLDIAIKSIYNEIDNLDKTIKCKEY